MKKLGLTLTAAFLACLALPVAAQAADEVFDMNFQSAYAGPHVLNVKAFEPWAKEMDEKSGGRLKIHFFMANAIMKTPDVIPSLINGNLDIGGGSVAYQEEMFPYSQVFQLPHLTKDSVHAAKVYQAILDGIPEIAPEMEKIGKMLTIWGSDRTGFFSTKGPILSPADLKGKRVLIWNGGQVDQIKAWGGVPVQITSGDTYLGLQRGMGDVFFGPLPMGVAYKLMEVSKDVTIIPASVIFGGVWVNRDLWNEIPADLQKLMEDSMGAAATERYGQYLLDATNKDIQTMKAAGCTIYELTEAQEQTFQDADREVTLDYWKKNLTRIGVKDADALITKTYEIANSIK